MNEVNVGDIRQYQAGTVACNSTRVAAVRDQAGKVWVAIDDFLRRNAGWVLAHPRYFEIDRCPSALVTNESGEVLLAGAAELAALLSCGLDGFEPTPDPAAGPVTSN